MDCDTPFLRVHTRSEHGSGTEQHAHRSGVHGVYHPLACLVGLALLNEAHLACRDAVVLRQLPLYLAVHVPSVARLVCSQIREHELRAFLRVVFVVILRNRLGAVGSLVVGVVLIMRVYHAHVESHLPRVIGGDKHLRLLLRFRQGRSAQQRGVTRLGELHQLFDEILLVGRGRYVMQYLVLTRTIHTHVLRRAVIGNLVVEGGKLRHFDEISETLLLNHIVRHVELEVGCLFGENCRPCVEASDILPFQFLRTQILEEQVQFRQTVGNGCAGQERSPQVLVRALLYSSYGKKHIQGFLASFRVSQPRHTVMPGVESQVLELVALVNEDVVDAHLLEVHYVIRAGFDGVFHFLQLRHKVVLAFLQSFQHRPRHVLALLPQHFKVFLHRVKLRLQDALLQLRRLWYLAELVVRHDDAIVVVVLDVVEKTHAVGSREILFRSVENPRIRICRLISGYYLRHVRLQADNHRLVRQVQTLHFMRCNTHYQCFTCSNFVVTDPASVLFYHPDAILLRRINALNTPACQSFQIEVGKRLVRTVILRSHETVELAVVHCRQPFLELRRLLFQPFREPVTDFVNLGVGELYALAVAHLDVIAMLILADGLHHVGAGVVQGVFQQVHTVIVPVIALH
ncbi:hypothetical protein EH215_04283 [Phocaeicola vulgatus]|nr:hypothetical protein EH215_04283 [Phocaeicola vulgatus]